MRKSRISSGLEAESIGIMRGVVAEFRNPVVDDERLPLKHGERQEMRLVRFRNLGCYPLTGAIESAAETPAEIVAEQRKARRSERQGQLIDSDEEAAVERKKREGFF